MSQDTAEEATNVSRKRWTWKARGAGVALSVFVSAVPVFAAHTGSVAGTERRLLDEAIGGQCVPEAAMQVLQSYQSQVASAATVDEARDLVLKQTRLARAALSAASSLLPFSESVRHARETIEVLEARVYAANTPSEVANDVSDMLELPALIGTGETPGAGTKAPMVLADVDLNKSAVNVRTGGGGGCDYTTGEIIIIILGFLLFIIPGIIFLIIFC